MPKILTLGFWEYEERIKETGGIRRYDALVERLLNALKNQPAMPLTNFSKGNACCRNFYAPASMVTQLDLYVHWRNSDRSQIIRQGLNAGLLNGNLIFSPSQRRGEKLIPVAVRLTTRDFKIIDAWLSRPSNVGFSLSDALRKIVCNLPLPPLCPTGSQKHEVKIPFYSEDLYLNLSRTAQVMETDLANVIKAYMCLSLHPKRDNRLTRYLAHFLSKPLMEVCPPPSFAFTEFKTGFVEES